MFNCTVKLYALQLRTAPQKTTNIGPIDQIAIIPKPPPYTKQLNLKKRRYEQQQLRREQLAKVWWNLLRWQMYEATESEYNDYNVR